MKSPRKSTLPTVGTPGYIAIGSDCYPVTLVKISKGGSKVTVQVDNFVGDTENGHDYFGTQVWKITRNPKGRLETFNWSKKYQRYRGSGSCYFGRWHAKQDPSF